MTELEIKKIVILGARYHEISEEEIKKRYQEFLKRLEKTKESQFTDNMEEKDNEPGTH